MAQAGDPWTCMECGQGTTLVLANIPVEGQPVQQLVCGCPTCHPGRAA